MGYIQDASETVLAALRGGLNGSGVTVRLTNDPKAASKEDPPFILVGPPALVFGNGCSEPTEAVFIIYAVANAERPSEALWALVESILPIIYETRVGVITEAGPGVYASSVGELPSYELTLNWPL